MQGIETRENFLVKSFALKYTEGIIFSVFSSGASSAPAIRKCRRTAQSGQSKLKDETQTVSRLDARGSTTSELLWKLWRSVWGKSSKTSLCPMKAISSHDIKAFLKYATGSELPMVLCSQWSRSGFGRSHTGGKALPLQELPRLLPHSPRRAVPSAGGALEGLTPPSVALEPGLVSVLPRLSSLVATGGLHTAGWGAWGGVVARTEECDARAGRRRTSAACTKIIEETTCSGVRRYGEETWDGKLGQKDHLHKRVHSIISYSIESCPPPCSIWSYLSLFLFWCILL